VAPGGPRLWRPSDRAGRPVDVAAEAVVPPGMGAVHERIDGVDEFRRPIQPVGELLGIRRATRARFTPFLTDSVSTLNASPGPVAASLWAAAAPPRTSATSPRTALAWQCLGPFISARGTSRLAGRAKGLTRGASDLASGRARLATCRPRMSTGSRRLRVAAIDVSVPRFG
jgi:hypothetical protein